MGFRVEFLGKGKSIEVDEGASLLEASFDAGVAIASTCGGQGTCGRCRVRVLSGEVSQRAAGAHAVKTEGGVYLACLTTVHSDVEVEVLGAGAREEQAIIGASKVLSVRDLDPGVQLVPPLARYLLKLDPPSLEDPTPDHERLRRAVGSICKDPEVKVDMAVLPALADTLRTNDFEITAAVLEDGACHTIVYVGPPALATRQCAFAVDIGTTTVAVQLLDCATGEVLAETSDYNAQHAFGEDVVSRIVFSMKGDGVARLVEAVTSTVDTLAAAALSKAGLDASTVSHVILAGNTTMIHLVYGLTPRYIREEPYVPTVSEVPWRRAGEVGLKAVPDAWVWAVPAVASWVGGDITSGILASGTAERDELELYIDIGTNGELVLGNKDWLMTCSCSAGPAFEGGGITHGMRAATGAIESVYIKNADATPEVGTIGGAPAAGICGSGLMDLVAEMFLVGLVDPNGKFNHTKPHSRLRQDEQGVWQYVVVGSHDAASGDAVALTEPDLDNLLRAKAAIYAAISLLTESVGLTVEQIERFTIAGGFGNKIKIRKAIDIGLMPDLAPERFDFFGNGSLKGALLCAASIDKVRLARELVRRMSYVELSVNPEFMDRYVSAMFLPHTEMSRFPSVAAALAERGGGRGVPDTPLPHEEPKG